MTGRSREPHRAQKTVPNDDRPFTGTSRALSKQRARARAPPAWGPREGCAWAPGCWWG